MHVGAERQLGQVESVLDALNCGAALLDREGLVLHANPRLCGMMARSRDQLVGRNVREFYASRDELKVIDEELAHADEAREREFVLPGPDGQRLPVMTSARPLPPPLDDLHVITILDISLQKRAELDLRENLRIITQVGDNAIDHAIGLTDYSHTLEQKVRDRTEELRRANLDAIYMLAVASEAKDSDTGRHVRRIQGFAESLARQLGMNADEAQTIGYSAILHDVGKIHVPDEILKKPGPLDENERFVMRQHTLFGERILSKRPFFERARRIARSHHENWDGSGYPDALARDAIPADARIVRIVDVYDALTTERVYKPAWTATRAVEFIEQAGGTSFDPEMIRAFRAMHASGELARLAEVPEDVAER
jgi:putative nucleotidyltransferase with HDIG domain/PAS domain S-box-containing protein